MSRLDLTKPPKPGQVFFDVCSGAEGPHLSIGDESSALRISGPKAWGGGSTLYRFPVKVEELKAAIIHYDPSERAQFLLDASIIREAAELLHSLSIRPGVKACSKWRQPIIDELLGIAGKMENEV